MKFICIFLLFNLSYLALAQDKKEVLEAKDKNIVIGNLNAPMLNLNEKEYLKKNYYSYSGQTTKISFSYSRR